MQRPPTPEETNGAERALVTCLAAKYTLVEMPILRLSGLVASLLILQLFAAARSTAQSTAVLEKTQTLEPAHPSSRSGVGLLAAAGLHTGLALGARLGVGDFGLELSGGYQLLLALWSDDLRNAHIDGASSGQLNAELYLTPWHPIPRSAIGLKGGWRYNTVLKQGFSIAIAFLGDIGPHLAIEGLAGASIFPGSLGRLRRELGIPVSGDIGYSSSIQFFEYGFELIWYP